MNLNKRIFFTGVPGSKWSGIAQILEDNISYFNTSDRQANKNYSRADFSGHKGAYFGHGMEYESRLDDSSYLDKPWDSPTGFRLIKSHEWAYVLEDIKDQYPNDWIMLIYRPDMTSYAWWHEAGGFKITYPNYSYYKDSSTMLSHIVNQNKCLLKFANKHNAIWHHFNSAFVKKYFNVDIEEVDNRYEDCLVCLIK